MKSIIFPLFTTAQHDNMRKRLIISDKNPWIVQDRFTQKIYKILPERTDNFLTITALGE